MIIYVGNLSLTVTEDVLKGLFQPFGEVQSVSIMNDKYIGSGQTRGYGFVEMSSKLACEAAVAGLQGTMINNRRIIIVEALPLERKGASYIGKRHNQPRRRDVEV